MEKSHIWKQFLNRMNSESVPLNCFRANPIIREIPLYEVNTYKEYIDYSYKIYNNKLYDNLNMWNWAMTHSNQGYTNSLDIYSMDSYQLDSVNTSTYNMKSNHHYFHYNTLTNQNINDFKNIVELGGGCGDFAKFTLNMGYTGNYTIIDIPEILEIQRYNLMGYDVNFSSHPISTTNTNTLFISTWALSECPLGWRDKIINALNPSNWLIIYQVNFQDINNNEYFDSWDGLRVDLPFIPWDGGSKYILK